MGAVRRCVRGHGSLWRRRSRARGWSADPRRPRGCPRARARRRPRGARRGEDARTRQRLTKNLGGFAPQPPSGVLAVDKPEGWTSHDVVAVVRGVLGTKRVGHGGTLDPQASGLLPVVVGTATKFADRIHEATKVYDALVRFGAETATDDREGAVTREGIVPSLAAETIEPGLAALRGVISQVPPEYAALKVGGRTAYARARSGETVALAARSVQVLRLDVIEISPPDLRLLVVCSSGTYVRAIARDLGRSLGSAAHLAALRRLAVGALEARDALTPEQLRARGREASGLLRAANEDLLTLDPRFLERSAATIVGAGESV
ncbi:MAG: tRNA pseudouridine(55) synthase TruB [Chloroflexi bacterium]|nr:MAG: tRNA pseudouridine(55) synthase TruB [Chloroflexota bacterium]